MQEVTDATQSRDIQLDADGTNGNGSFLWVFGASGDLMTTLEFYTTPQRANLSAVGSVDELAHALAPDKVDDTGCPPVRYGDLA